jgi:Trypsin
MVRFEVSFTILVTIFVATVTCQRIDRRMLITAEAEKGIMDLPWVVAFCTEEFSVLGTGSIVSEKWVLTVAHLWDESTR